MSGKPDSEVDFAVVGAGLGGIRTALALIGSGASVTVFKARERVGGRVFSAPPAADGADEPPLALDLGAQWVGPGQTEILQLIEELDLHTVPTGAPGRALWGLSGSLRQGRADLPPLPPLGRGARGGRAGGFHVQAHPAGFAVASGQGPAMGRHFGWRLDTPESAHSRRPGLCPDLYHREYGHRAARNVHARSSL